METSILKRLGECKRCGQCCKRHTPVGDRIVEAACDFLSFDSEGRAECLVYSARAQECRDYPAGPENLRPGCGYRFE